MHVWVPIKRNCNIRILQNITGSDSSHSDIAAILLRRSLCCNKDEVINHRNLYDFSLSSLKYWMKWWFSNMLIHVMEEEKPLRLFFNKAEAGIVFFLFWISRKRNIIIPTFCSSVRSFIWFVWTQILSQNILISNNNIDNTLNIWSENSHWLVEPCCSLLPPLNSQRNALRQPCQFEQWMDKL